MIELRRKVKELTRGGAEIVIFPGDDVERARGAGEREDEQVAAVALPRDGPAATRFLMLSWSFSRAATWSASVFSPAARRKSSAERWLPLPFSRSRSGCDCKSAASGIFCALAAENSGVFGAMSTMAS